MFRHNICLRLKNVSRQRYAPHFLSVEINPTIKTFSTSSQPPRVESRFIDSEIFKFRKYNRVLQNRIEECKNMMYDDFIATSATETSHISDTSYEVSGPFQYYFHRERHSNYGNLFRVLLDQERGGGTVKPKGALILDIDHLAKYYHRPVSLTNIKLSEDHNLIAFTLEVLNDSDTLHSDDHRNTKLLVKNIDMNVLCEVMLPNNLTPADVEITAGGQTHDSPTITVFLSTSSDGIRPSSVHRLRLDAQLVFGKAERAQLQPTEVVRGRHRSRKKPVGSLPRHSAMRTCSVGASDLVLLAEETDAAFFVDLAKSRDETMLLIHHHSKASSEVAAMRIVESLQQGGRSAAECELKTLVPRMTGQQCYVNHAHDCFYVASASNPHDKTEELMIRTTRSRSHLSSRFTTGWDHWDVVWPCAAEGAGDRQARDNFNRRFILDDYDIFDKHILVYARDKDEMGDVSIQLLRLTNAENDNDVDDGSKHRVEFVKSWTGKAFRALVEAAHGPSGDSSAPPEDMAWTVTPGTNGNFKTNTARFSLSSAVLPEVSVAINLETAEVEDLKCRFSTLVSLPGFSATAATASQDKPSLLTRLSTMFKSSPPVCENDSPKARREVRCQRPILNSSKDQYPIPLLIHTPEGVVFPCRTLLIGYGAYGVSVPTQYDSQVSLYLRRGWVVAFACTRGGGELGKIHHHSGKDLKKWNTFFDFKDCAEYLIARDITSPALLCASGNSAGGLIMGVMLNHYSHLFRAFIMRNPFLDIGTSVTDPSSPLTVHEYDEWGHVQSAGAAGDAGGTVDLSSERDGDRDRDSSALMLQMINSYSPCANINHLVNPSGGVVRVTSSTRRLPSVLVTVGLQDEKVSPQESFKWMTRLREAYSALEEEEEEEAAGQQERLAGTPALLLNIRNEGHEGPATVEEQCHGAAIEIAFLENEVESMLANTPR